METIAVQLRKARPANRQSGISLIELVIALAVLVVTVSVAIPAYNGYRKEAQLNAIVNQMVQIELVLQDYRLNEGAYPETLEEAGTARDDPWGQPYRYLPLENRPDNLNDARKDHNLHPINSDFDLYSVGADGHTVKPLTGDPSKDDIIRARNGAFHGYGQDY